MGGRPTSRSIGLELILLGAAAGVAIAIEPQSTWHPPLLAVLLAAAIVSDITAVETPASRVKVSSSFLAIVTAIVFCGGTPAAALGVLTILAGWARSRYPHNDLLINLVTYAWFPLLAGVAFHAVQAATGTSQTDPAFYLLVFGTFVVALLIDFALIAGYSCYV